METSKLYVVTFGIIAFQTSDGDNNDIDVDDDDHHWRYRLLFITSLHRGSTPARRTVQCQQRPFAALQTWSGLADTIARTDDPPSFNHNDNIRLTILRYHYHEASTLAQLSNDIQLVAHDIGDGYHVRWETLILIQYAALKFTNHRLTTTKNIKWESQQVMSFKKKEWCFDKHDK